jgi:hypothetical protein
MPYDQPSFASDQKGRLMTKIDQALIACRQDSEAQPLFYDLFLNSLFFIPTVGEETVGEETVGEDGGATPLLVEAEGKDYLMLFDTIKRLTDWAEEGAKYVVLPGHLITEMSLPNLYWAMNYGTEHQKQFELEEIAWLKEVVRQCNEDQPQSKE